MRIALFDGIVETHVGSSLERALIVAGHEVFNTGKIGHGYSFVSNISSQQIIENALNQVLDYKPDVIFVFRPGSLPYPLLKRAKASGAILVAWFSDDPVLWNLSYGPVVDSYDVVLHCGTSRVLEFYEEMHGRPTGVNFPFWTDEVAFPYVYGERELEHDAIFLGNVHDEVRRQRYFDLATLNSNIRIYGNVARDYHGIWGGYLDSDAEVVEAGRRAGLAINIPQYFRDHIGLDTWFDGLDNLGFFQYPSRVIQYAAMGLPVISVVPDASDLSSFPEISCVSDMQGLDQRIEYLLSSNAAADLSRATHERFLKSFTATARVMALESLLLDDSWRKLDPMERSSWFTQFDGSAGGTVDHAGFVGKFSEIVDSQVEDANTSKLRIALIGENLDRVSSFSSVTARALINLGHDLTSYEAEEQTGILRESDHAGFEYKLVVEDFLASFGVTLDLLVISSIDCELALPDIALLRANGIKIVYIGCVASKLDNRLEAIASSVDYLGLLNSDIADKLIRSGYENTEYLPYLVDEAFIAELGKIAEVSDDIVVAGNRKIHFSSQSRSFGDLDELSLRQVYIEDDDPSFYNLGKLAASLRSTIIIVPFNSSLLGPLPSEVMPFALASGALVVVPRGVGPMNIGIPGVVSVAARERGELALKFKDLAVSHERIQDILEAAENLVRSELNAERRLEGMLAALSESGQAEHVSVSKIGDRHSLSFDPAASSFNANWSAANGHGTLVDLEISLLDFRVSAERVCIQIVVNNQSIYTEYMSGGQGPIKLAVDVSRQHREFLFQVVQSPVDGYAGYKRPMIEIRSIAITKPEEPVEAIRVRSNSVWGTLA